MDNNHYIYFHINLVSNEVFYVGKGKGRRAWSKDKRSYHWYNTVKKYGYRVDIVEDNLTDDISLQREIFYINKIGRKDLGLGTLVNHTDGGEGISGLKHSEESKQKMKKPKSEDFIKKITGANNHFFNKKHTQESKNKISDSRLGKNNRGWGNKCIYNNEEFKTKKDVWKKYFQDISYWTFKDKTQKNKIEGLVTI
jgi:hypothetical protein